MYTTEVIAGDPPAHRKQRIILQRDHELKEKTKIHETDNQGREVTKIPGTTR